MIASNELDEGGPSIHLRHPDRGSPQQTGIRQLAPVGGGGRPGAHGVVRRGVSHPSCRGHEVLIDHHWGRYADSGRLTRDSGVCSPPPTSGTAPVLPWVACVDRRPSKFTQATQFQQPRSTGPDRSDEG